MYIMGESCACTTIYFISLQGDRMMAHIVFFEHLIFLLIMEIKIKTRVFLFS